MLIIPRGSPAPITELAWYIVYTTPQGERLFKEDMEGMGLHPFYPCERVWHRPARHRRDQERKLIERPLFPRYVFVGLNPQRLDFDALLRSKRMVEILCDPFARPQRIRTAEVVALMDEVERGDYDEAVLRLAKLTGLIGKHAQIHSGPFAGYGGQIVAVDRKSAKIEVSGPNGAAFAINLPLAELGRAGLYSVQDDQHKQSATERRLTQRPPATNR